MTRENRGQAAVTLKREFGVLGGVTLIVGSVIGKRVGGGGGVMIPISLTTLFL